jgi:YihY family inner membrane protein
MNPVERVARATDGWQQRSSLLGFTFAVFRKFGDDQAGGLAGLIAYYAFFSVFPLLLVFVTVVGFVLGSDNDLTSRALNSFPVVGREIARGSLRGSGLALVLGIVLAVWAGMRVVQGMQEAMNRVWNVPMKRRPGFMERLGRSLVMLVILGAATIGATILSGVGTSGAVGTLVRVAGILLALVVNVGLYLLAFRVLTEEHLSWGTVLPGAVLAGVAWTLLQILGGWYVNHQIQGASQTYGAFAVVIGLLSWLYLGAQVSLLAAEVNVVRARRLWPRSLVPPPLTPADRDVLQAAAEETARRPEQTVSVRFEEAPAKVPPPEHRNR